jgi:vacuolar-type H+-ATPase subunit D/Vma8
MRRANSDFPDPLVPRTFKMMAIRSSARRVQSLEDSIIPKLAEAVH